MKGFAKAIGILAGTAVLAVAACNVFVIKSTQDCIVGRREAVDFGADCILVLGAAVRPSGVPTAILQDRLNEAAELYFAGAAPRIIVSGNDGEASNHEAAVMKAYLVDMGIPSQDVFCDPAGFNTYDSMWRARNIFGVNAIIVVTQTYHEYRALFNARGVGMDAVGASSDARTYRHQAYYDFREMLARPKDAIQVLMHRKAAIQGEPVLLDSLGM